MQNRRQFLLQSLAVSLGTVAFPKTLLASPGITSNPGVQLYTFRTAMAEDAAGTLQKIAALGIKQIESARSDKGNYYGLAAAEMKKICEDHGMKLRSGHVHLDTKWKETLGQAAEAKQEYLICSTMPSSGQTLDNYKKVAEQFNKAGEDCRKMGIKFGYHNHEYEFETAGGEVLYDVLLQHTDPKLVHMELDLGWVIVAGKDPIDYFTRFPGRFPLWHLKDMDMGKKESTEFGKGGLDIKKMLVSAKKAGMKYFFIEQEEYTNNPWDSMKANMAYLEKLS